MYYVKNGKFCQGGYMKEYKKIGNVILEIKTGLEWKLGRERNTTWKEANEWIKK